MSRETRVYTESTCGVCRRVEREEGAQGECPPPGWAYIRMSRRLAGCGWTNSDRLLDTNICPEYSEKVLAALKEWSE